MASLRLRHVAPRHSQLLLAGCVELRELGDGGNLTEQPQPIKSPLLNGAGRPRQLRRPAHLAFDLLDKEANLFSGSFGPQAQDLKLQSLHSVALLSVRREWPCHRAAQTCDELPPPHR
jgi:hypothetical protein